MMLRTLLTSVALVTTMTAVLAQPAPFDMTPEDGLVTPTAPPMPDEVPAAAQPEVVAPPTFVRNILPQANLRLVGEEAKSAVVVYLAGIYFQKFRLNALIYIRLYVRNPTLCILRRGVFCHAGQYIVIDYIEILHGTWDHCDNDLKVDTLIPGIQITIDGGEYLR